MVERQAHPGGEDFSWETRSYYSCDAEDTQQVTVIHFWQLASYAVGKIDKFKIWDASRKFLQLRSFNPISKVIGFFVDCFTK